MAYLPSRSFVQGLTFLVKFGNIYQNGRKALTTLRDLYHGKGLNTIQVAALAGVSDTTINAMSRKEAYVKDVTIAKVCQALNITRAQYDALDVCPMAERYRSP